MNAVFQKSLDWPISTTDGRIALGIGVALAIIIAVGALLCLAYEGTWTFHTTLLSVGAATCLISPFLPGPILDEISLHDAACLNDCAKIDRFLELDGLIDCQDEAGNTALHLAARWGALTGLQHLISKGADLNAVNNKGQTPLHAAIERACPSICGTRPTADCWYQTVYWLIYHGADLDIEDSGKRTPLKLATQKEDWAIEDLLVKTLEAKEKSTPDKSGDIYK